MYCNFVQIVTEPTRLNPDTILDPVITSLSNYYQKPICVRPLDTDKENYGKISDHQIVLVNPRSKLNNKSSRVKREIKYRPLTQKGMIKMGEWLKHFSWAPVFEVSTANNKAELFQNILLIKYFEFFPEKCRIISNDDQPWISGITKKVDRRKRVFNKERK